MSRKYQLCSRCVTDTSAGNIVFNLDGTCNFCTEFLDRCGNVLNKDPAQRQLERDVFVGKIKADGKGKQYDCIIGVSGGVDSSWALIQAVRLGLRPLAVHMDNGWNTELAQNNIENLIRGLGVDLYTHVIENGDEYRKLMQAFFDADVIDVELLTDNAILAVNYQQAAKYRVKFILAGSNTSSEGMPLPKGWNWFKLDKRNIRAIGKTVGHVQLHSFPTVGTMGYIWNEVVRRRKWISFLDYFDYNKFEAMAVLQRDFGYKPYPYKHYESICTRFYQGYILPEKFNVDKRRTHLSTLVASGQMTREDALKSLEGNPYPSEKALEEDKQYFVKKMGWTIKQLDEYIARPEQPHTKYPSERDLYNRCLNIYRLLFKKKATKTR